MAGPSYNPLQVPQQVQVPNQGLIGQSFNQPFMPFEDILQQQALQRAREITNQSNELALAQKEREELGRQELASKIQADPNIDIGKALELAQRITLGTGNISGAVDIERAQNAYGSNRRLTPEEAQTYIDQGLTLPPNPTVADVRFGISLRNSGIAQGNLDARTTNRPLPTVHETELVGLKESEDLISNVIQRHIPYITENRGMRFLEAAANPNSAIARLNNELVPVTQALIAAKNGKRISDADYEYMKPLVTPTDLDTIATMEDKLNRAIEFTRIRRGALLDVLQKSKRDVSNFLEPQDPIGLANSLMGGSQSQAPFARGVPPPGLSREQFSEWFRSQRGP